MSRKTKIDNLRKAALDIDAKMEKLRFRQLEIQARMKELIMEERKAVEREAELSKARERKSLVASGRSNATLDPFEELSDVRVPEPASSTVPERAVPKVQGSSIFSRNPSSKVENTESSARISADFRTRDS